MESSKFITEYNSYLEEIGQVIKPQLLHIIDELKEIDPHDLVRTDTFFDSENSARGYVWELFLKRAENYTIRKAN